MHRHHLHQRGVAFQAQLAVVGRDGGLRPLLRQVPHQRVLAVDQRAGLLQQLGQVQQVGELALVAARQQPPRHPEVVQQPAQHRQHALALPALAVAAKLHQPLVPVRLVLVQPLQRWPVQLQQRGAQCGAHQPAVLGLGAGLQQPLQLGRLPGWQKTFSCSDR